MKSLLWCAVCAIMFSCCLLTIGLGSGTPGWWQGIFIFAGLPGYGVATTITTIAFGPDDINSRRVLVYFGIIYVLVNAAFFNSVFIAAWQTIAALARLSKRRRI